MGVGPMFRDHLRGYLGVDVTRALDVGELDLLDNGTLQRAALGEGYTHMVTHDKRMASDHPPHMPVVAIDDPMQPYPAGSILTPAEARERNKAAARATAEFLMSKELGIGYHAVEVHGYLTSKKTWCDCGRSPSPKPRLQGKGRVGGKAQSRARRRFDALTASTDRPRLVC